jgi:hypothetical protein
VKKRLAQAGQLKEERTSELSQEITVYEAFG